MIFPYILSHFGAETETKHVFDPLFRDLDPLQNPTKLCPGKRRCHTLPSLPRHAGGQLPLPGAALGVALLWPQLAAGTATQPMAQQPQGAGMKVGET